MPRQAVFRADASAAIGGGHVMRCLALADHLAEIGWSCGFAVRPETLAAVSALAASRHDILPLSRRESDEADEIRLYTLQRIELLIVDHYQRDAKFESACRPWARRILAIDDLADRIHDADLLLDQTLGRHPTEYASCVPAGCRMLLGPMYALLRPQFARQHPCALARRHDGLRRVLICMGNSDPHDVTSTALRAVGMSGINITGDVVLGSISPNLAAVENEIARYKGKIRLHVDAPNMADLMLKADVSIGSSGFIAWERCSMGLPTIAVVVAANQRTIAANLAAVGAIRLVGDVADCSDEKISAALADFARRPELLSEMSRKAAAICDGGGVERTVSAIDSIQ
jgi:UDP-2,4-diacetamido-2,4,6-trideoxy-beta-L-altropyranose hydrolase